MERMELIKQRITLVERTVSKNDEEQCLMYTTIYRRATSTVRFSLAHSLSIDLICHQQPGEHSR
jgi:hypothetical protein